MDLVIMDIKVDIVVVFVVMGGLRGGFRGDSRDGPHGGFRGVFCCGAGGNAYVNSRSGVQCYCCGGYAHIQRDCTWARH